MSRLELDGLTRRYGPVTALDHLSFSVASGQVTGFLGPNGAGKTTTMRAVFGLTDLDAGTVRWNGADVTMSDRRRFGYLPEERGLYPGMLVAEQLEYLGRLHGLSPAAAAAAGTGWLERLGIAARAASKVESLSLGNQQRVQLASALVHNPDLLVLDEPLSGLDPEGIDAVGEVLASHARPAAPRGPGGRGPGRNLGARALGGHGVRERRRRAPPGPRRNRWRPETAVRPRGRP